MLGPLFVSLIMAKPVAVMVHGAGGGGWEYRTWKTVFERAGYRVVAMDLMPSRKGLAETTTQDYVDQVVRASGNHPDVLIGASMGGVLVLRAAERVHPRALVLVCSAIPAGVGEPGKPQTYPKIVRWAHGPYSDTVASMPDSDEATRRFAYPRWRDESGAVLNDLVNGVKVEVPKSPVLSIIPEADDTVPPVRQQALAAWAGADTFRFKGMSHVGTLMSRRAPEVAKAVVDWVRNRRRAVR